MGAKHMQSNSSMVGQVSKSHKMLCKAVDRPSKELQQPSSQNLAATSSNKLGSTASTRLTCCRSRKFCTCKSCVEDGRQNEISLKLVQKNEAAEPFLNKKFVGVADQQCKQLLDALGIFNSNKELFINLLQDPNSLLIKHIEDSTDSGDRKQQTKTFFDGKLSENKLREMGEYEEPANTQNLKPCDRLPSEESDDSESLERIVVLKPNPTSSQHSAVGTDYCHSLQSHSTFTNIVQSDKGTLFSFRHIKKKMRQAMRIGRKEGECQTNHGVSKKTPLVCRASKDVGKRMAMEVTGKNPYSNIQTDDKGISGSFQYSPKRDQLEKAFYSRNGDKTASTSESTGERVGQSAVSHLKRQKSKKRDGDKEGSRKMKAKPWGWVMCFSDDDILPSNKPGCHSAGHMRYSHLSNKKIVYEKKSKPQNEEKQSCEIPQKAKVEASSAEIRRDNDQLHKSNTELNMSHAIFPDVKVDEDLVVEGSMKIIKDIATIQQEGNSLCEASSGLDNTCNTSFCQRTSKTKGFGEKGNLELSILNSPLEVQPSTFSVHTFPSSPSKFQTVEDPNGLKLDDREVQPHPESIHDKLLVDASSYPGFTLGTAESSVEVFPFNSEEHRSTGLARLQEVLNPAIATFTCCGSISKYVLELLQASKLNWNEPSMECHSSAWLQIPFVDKVKVFNSQLCGDCLLLFDYINEVLEDVFHCYIRCSPWLSSYKAHLQAPDKERALYHEVMKHLDWPLLQQQPPQTLEHLFVRDLMISKTWISFPAETEEVVTIIAELVLEELTIESKGLEKMLVVFALLVGAAVAFGEQGILSQEEDLELNRQLKQLNRPALKSFRTEFGDIIDCVDIFKQPAFSHPLLKNHTIQMKPSTIPTGLISDTSKGERLSQQLISVNKCPGGSVPIRRTRKEDLIAAKHLKSLRSHPSTDKVRPSASIDVDGHHFAVLNYRSNVFGAKSQINVWNTSARKDQFSIASMWLTEGSRDQVNSVQAGWGVIPHFLGEGSRLFVFWTADGYQRTGCYNTLCPGFVQVSSEFIPGHPLNPTSVYSGPQYHISVSIHKDTATGNWLFMLGDKYVGYWPKALVPGLSSGATFVSWGGEVYSQTSVPSPAMGSGHYPEEGFGKSAFVNQIQVTHGGLQSFVDPDDSELVLSADHPICYSAIHKFTEDRNWGHHIFYGGPGNCVFKG